MFHESLHLGERLLTRTHAKLLATITLLNWYSKLNLMQLIKKKTINSVK